MYIHHIGITILLFLLHFFHSPWQAGWSGHFPLDTTTASVLLTQNILLFINNKVRTKRTTVVRRCPSTQFLFLKYQLKDMVFRFSANGFPGGYCKTRIDGAPRKTAWLPRMTFYLFSWIYSDYTVSSSKLKLVVFRPAREINDVGPQPVVGGLSSNPLRNTRNCSSFFQAKRALCQ